MAPGGRLYIHIYIYIKVGRRDEEEVDRAGSRKLEDGGGPRLLNMTDRSLGKLSKYTVRPSPSSGKGVGCWLSHISYRFETTPVHERLLAGYFPRRYRGESKPSRGCGNRASMGPLNFYDLVLASRICWHPRRRILPAVSNTRTDRTSSTDVGNYSKRGVERFIRGDPTKDPGKSGQCLERRQLRRIRRSLPPPPPFLHVYMQRLRWTGFPRPVINSCRLRHGFST